MDQQKLWDDVGTIKRHVRETIGLELSGEFRSSPVYKGYMSLCGEAQMAYANGVLSQAIVTLLKEYADKVIDHYLRVPA